MKFTCEITDLTHEGAGIARHNNMVYFIEGGIPGDLIEAEHTEKKKRFCLAKIKKILTPSPDRIASCCSYYPKCGGCDMLDMKYSAQLSWKKHMFTEQMKRIGKLTPPENITISGAQDPYHYRNKIQFPAQNQNGRLILGFYERRSHSLIPVKACMVQPEIVDSLLIFIEKICNQYGITAYDETNHTGLLRHVIIRYSAFQNRFLVIFSANSTDSEPFKKLTTALNSNFSGLASAWLCPNTSKTNRILGKSVFPLIENSVLSEKIGDCIFEISPLSFFQINSVQCHTLYTIVRSMVKEVNPKAILDLYCGTGTIGIFVSRSTQKLTGADSVSSAIEDARKNALCNHMNNTEFICMDLGKELISFNLYDTVIVDPPRKGLSIQVVNALKTSCVKTIIYVSCNPSTLARDLAIMTEYSVKRIQLVDMFPHTIHVEAAVMLVRNNN